MAPFCTIQKGSVSMASILAQEKMYTLDDIYKLSDGSRAMDYYTKLSLYREAGAREYWWIP